MQNFWAADHLRCAVDTMAPSRSTLAPADTSDSDEEAPCPLPFDESGLDAVPGDSNEGNCFDSPQLGRTIRPSLTATDRGPSSPDAEAPYPVPFDLPFDSLPGSSSSSGGSGREGLRSGPTAGSASPVSDHAPPSSDEFSDEGIGFGETGGGTGTATAQAEAHDVGTTSDRPGPGESVEDPSLEEDENEDEAICFGPPAPLTRVITGNDGHVGDGASSLDDEGVDFGPPRPPLIVSSNPNPSIANKLPAVDQRGNNGRSGMAPEKRSFFSRRRNSVNARSSGAGDGRMSGDSNTLELASSADVSRESRWWSFGTRGMAFTLRPCADGDEGVSLNTMSPPSVQQQNPHAATQEPSRDEGEAISFDAPQPQTHSTEPQPPSTPRVEHVSLNQVLHGRPSDAHLSDDGVPERPRLRLLNPMDMTDEEAPPDVSLPESMGADGPSVPLGRLADELNSPAAAARGPDTSSNSEGGQGYGANSEEEVDDEMFSQPTAIQLGDEDAAFEWEDDNDNEVIPASPSPAAMERIHNLPSARLLRIFGSFRPEMIELREGSTFSERGAVSHRSRRDSGCGAPDGEEEADNPLPPLPPRPFFARDRIIRPERFSLGPSYFRASTVAPDPTSLLSDRPYTELCNTRKRRASTSAA